jgi:hypothetical protein
VGGYSTEIITNVTVSLCLINSPPRHEGVRDNESITRPLLTSALDGVEWSASRHGRFTPGEKSPRTHWIGGWVGPRIGLDAVE